MAMSTRARRRMLVLLLLILLGGGGMYGMWRVRTSMQDAKASEALDAGTQAYEEGRMEDALGDLSTYVSRYKEDSNALYMLADARSRIPIADQPVRHLLSAIRLAKESAQMDQADLRPRVLLLSLYLRFDMQDTGVEALSTIEEILAIQPDHFDALRARVDVHSSMLQNEEALTAAAALVDAYPENYGAQTVLIQSQIRSGLPPEEIVAYAAGLVEEFPDRAEFLALLANLQLANGQREEAQETAQRAAEAEIEGAEVLELVASVLENVGLRSEASRLINERIASGEAGFEGAYALALRQWQQGNARNAIRTIANHRSDALAASDDVLGRIAYIEFVANAGSTYGDLLAARESDLAQTWSQVIDVQRRFDAHGASDVMSELQSLSQRLSREPIVFAMMARAELVMGESLLAIGHYERAVKLAPRWLGPRLELVEVLLRNGKSKTAYDHATEAYNAAPDSVLARHALLEVATQLIEQGERVPRVGWENAVLVDLEAFADALPSERPLLWARLIRANAALGRHADANRWLDLFLDEGSSIPDQQARRLVETALRAGLARANELQVGGVDGEGAGVLTQALRAAKDGRVDEGKALLRKEVEQSEGQARIFAELNLAMFLDRIRDPDALDVIKRLSDEYAKDAALLADVLSSDIIWTDRDAAELAIARLRQATGEGGFNWKIFDARSKLTFDRSEKAASEALSLLTEVLTSAPDEIDALVLSADARDVLGDITSSIELMRHAVEVSPERATLHATLINCLLRAGRPSEAGDELRAYAEMTGLNDTERRVRARLLMAQGMVDLAQADLESLREKSVGTDLLLEAQVAQHSGDIERAKSLFTEIANDANMIPMGYLKAAEYFIDLGDTELAWSLLDRANPSDNDADKFRSRARFALDRGHTKLAIDIARGLTLRGDADPIDFSLLALALLRSGDLDGAETAVASVGNEDARIASAVRLSRLAVDNGRGDLVAFFGALASSNDDASEDIFSCYKDNLEGQSDRIQFIGRLTAHVASNPGSAIGWSSLAVELARDGDVDRALDTLSNAIDNAPQSDLLAVRGFEIAYSAQRFSEAEAFAKVWLAKQPMRTFEPEMAIAAAQAKLGRWDTAMQRLEPFRDRIIAEVDSQPGRFVLFTQALAASGDLDAAADLLEPRLDIGEAWVSAYCALADATTDRSARLVFLNRAEQHVDTSNAGRAMLGERWQADGDRTGETSSWQHAIDLLEPVVRDPRFAATGFALRGAAHERLEHFPEAERDYRASLDAGPGQPLVLNNLAFLILKMDGSASESRDFASQAVVIMNEAGSPNAYRATAMDTLGSALVRLGSFGEAEAVFREAILLASGNRMLTIRLQIGLAEALLGLGRADEAGAELASALSGVPENSLAKDVAERIIRIRENLGK